MDFLKDGAKNLTALGFGAAVPGLRDRAMELVTGDQAKQQSDRINALEAASLDKKDKERATTPMKKGGKVSSASKRADGCCVKGKTRA